MKNILEALALRPVAGDLGIEIEVEGTRLPTDAGRGSNWNIAMDNSLRGGYEYIIKRPILLAEVKDNVHFLRKLFQQEGAKPVFSFRTSTHVHLNVQQLTYAQLLTLIYTYLLVEGPMVDFCGDVRKGNRFCLRLADAEGLMDTLAVLFAGDYSSMRYIGRGEVRYSALNLEALTKYGSIEFRSMRGTLDIGTIYDWCQSIIDLRTFSLKFNSPMEVYEEYVKCTPSSFLKKVFPNTADKLYNDNTDKQMAMSFSLAICLPHDFESRSIDAIAPKASLDEILERILLEGGPIPNPRVVGAGIRRRGMVVMDDIFERDEPVPELDGDD
jgi:hypothetical protein